MARPPTQRIAGRQARDLLARTLRGTRKQTLNTHLERAERLGQTIWRHWQRGPYQWQVKHVRWYLTRKLNDLTPATQYRYWLTVRAIVYALGKETDWLPHLEGPWLRPTGEKGELKAGRPPKLPQAIPKMNRRDVDGDSDNP
jgi:hypothetical protein